MTDYEKGFNDGFAAAVHQGLPRSPRSIAKGFETAENTRRIVLSMPVEMFDFLNQRARASSRSFAAEVRDMIKSVRGQ